MHKALSRSLAAVILLCAACAQYLPAQESPQQRRGAGQPDRGVYKARIEPHWFANDTQFWYRNDLRGGAKEFILVDAEKGTRQRAFDHEKLAAALAKAAGEDIKPDKLPFSNIEFIDNGNSIKFEASGKSWRLQGAH